MTDASAAPPAGDAPAEDLTLEQQLEQVEEAADAVAEAIETGDVERAENIMRQLETWRENLSSTLEAARSQSNPQLAETLEELRALREEVTALRTPATPSALTPHSAPPLETPPASATPTPTPHSDASQTEPPVSGDREEQAQEPPAAPESPRQKRRAI